MKSLPLGIFLLILAWSPAGNVVAEEAPPQVVVMLSTDDPQVAGMALHMAWGMKRMTNAEITVILGAGSLRFALKEGDSPMFPPKKKNMRAVMQDVLDQGSKVYVCSMCAFAQQIKQEQLLDGVTIETGGVIMPLLADPKIKVLSF
ncbi:DsrE family protein [Thiolapillus sp.]